VFVSMCWFVTREHRLDYSQTLQPLGTYFVRCKLIGRLMEIRLRLGAGVGISEMISDLSQQLFEQCKSSKR